MGYGVYNQRQEEDSNKGNKHTQETKDYLRSLYLGKKQTPEHIKNAASERTRPVMQIDIKTQQIIKKWSGAIEVEKELKIHRTSIYKVCLGKIKTAGGYKWQYVNS